MKKILLASTALALSAGVANAQGLAVTGLGRMGIQYANWAPYGGNNTRIESRFQLDFTATVTADHGLSFGAYSRARMATAGAGIANAGGLSGARVWAEANGLRLTFGNVDGAFAGLAVGGGTVGYTGMSFVGLAGIASNGDTQEFQSIGPAEAARVRVDYTMGSTRFALSYDTHNTWVLPNGNTLPVNQLEVAVQSTFNAFTVAAGISDDGLGNNEWFLGGRYNGGNWTVGATYYDTVAFGNWVVSGSVNVGGGTLNGYAGDVYGEQVYGVGYAYGLGGGARIAAGVERNNTLARTSAEVGVVFTF